MTSKKSLLNLAFRWISLWNFHASNITYPSSTSYSGILWFWCILYFKGVYPLLVDLRIQWQNFVSSLFRPWRLQKSYCFCSKLIGSVVTVWSSKMFNKNVHQKWSSKMWAETLLRVFDLICARRNSEKHSDKFSHDRFHLKFHFLEMNIFNQRKIMILKVSLENH